MSDLKTLVISPIALLVEFPIYSILKPIEDKAKPKVSK